MPTSSDYTTLAIAVAIEAIAAADTRVDDVRLVCFGQDVYEAVLEQLAARAPNQP